MAISVSKLIGAVKVEPVSAAPGTPVTVQVQNPDGTPYTDGGPVLVTIDGVEGSRRVFQFPTAGTRKLVVRAVQAGVSETSTVTVAVAGEIAAPMLLASNAPGSPYATTFSLGTTQAQRRALALEHPMSGKRPRGPQPAPKTATPVAVDGAHNGSQLSKALEGVAPEERITVPARTVSDGPGIKAVTSAAAGPVKGIAPAAPAATSYHWDFGDGTLATTNAPSVTHDYLPAIADDRIARSFHVTCTIMHSATVGEVLPQQPRPVRPGTPVAPLPASTTVTRTFVLHSAYGLSRRLGTIVPPLTGDVFATPQGDGLAGSLIIRNLEQQPITLERMSYVPLRPDPEADLPEPVLTAMSTPVTIPARAAAGLGVSLSAAQLANAGIVAGFTVSYSGQAADKTPVRFSYTFRVTLAEQRAFAPTSAKPRRPLGQAARQSVLGVVTDPGGPITHGAESLVIDPATSSIAIILTADPASAGTATRVRSGVLAGYATAAPAARAVRGLAPVRTLAPVQAHGFGVAQAKPLLGPTPPGPVQPGAVCDPDNISDADAAQAQAQGLACQLTDETQGVVMPGSFQNAFKGDVILSASDDSPISYLLRALNPPQHHSHSGIMTDNCFEITHCTASSERMGDHTVGLGGSGGIEPDALQYAWPGSVTQSVDAAVGAVIETRLDPDQTPYAVSGFHPTPVGMTTTQPGGSVTASDGFELIPSMVVKPLPENEQALRPALRAAADIARSKGQLVDATGAETSPAGAYYCFYSYTKPEAAAGFGDPAPGTTGWASGLSPAVCSSFVWLCMKEAGVHLVTASQYETTSDLTPTETEAGAAVGVGTLDGLFYYSETERKEAGEVLDGIFHNLILDKEGFFSNIPLLGDEVARSIADQFMNMFAFGDPTMVGSTAWQDHPGDANAVSPDNIEFWQKEFGYVEPLQYLQQHTEQYTVSRWTQIPTQTPSSGEPSTPTTGTVSGSVTLNGAPVQGATVWVYDGKEATTDSAGHYELDDVPVGFYMIQARVVQEGIEYSNTPGGQGQKIHLSSDQPNLIFDIPLQAPGVWYRILDLMYAWTSDHGDWNSFNTHGDYSVPMEEQFIPVGPGKVTNHGSVSYAYAGGGYFTCTYTFIVVLAQDLSLAVTLVGQMTNDGGSDVQAEQTLTFNVPEDGQYVWELDMEVDGVTYHNGPSKFTGMATNRRETT